MRAPRALRGRLELEFGEPRVIAAAAVEIVLAVALATAGVAALQSTTPPARLEILYLLAVLAVAIRRGQVAALLTALLSALTMNYLFIAPRHQLAIAHSQDVVALIVLVIAAIVVGRLAAIGRERAAEAERRTGIASAREREAKLVAEAASAILPASGVGAQLQVIGKLVASATGASRARLALEPVPSPADGELAVPLHGGARTGWLYVAKDAAWGRDEVERIAEPLGRLIDVAVERQRVAERAAETEAARRAEVAKTAVLHAISHDLRSPLTAIATAGSALRTAAVTDAERRELLDVIQSEVARLAKLVDDLLDLSRIESGAVAPQADWCDLHDVVTSTVVQAGRDDRIDVELPAQLPLVRADAAQLERVFSNLIDNAVKFSPPDSPIRITGGASAATVTVRVTDQGRGISREERIHVFEPFFRGRGGTGSGLGLAICRGFVEANGGQLVLQTGGDRGTSFAVSFPIARPQR
jgi:two-component system sensor histidine kinase KdpD